MRAHVLDERARILKHGGALVKTITRNIIESAGESVYVAARSIFIRIERIDNGASTRKVVTGHICFGRTPRTLCVVDVFRASSLKIIFSRLVRRTLWRVELPQTTTVEPFTR